jgi:hypothetical protein
MHSNHQHFSHHFTKQDQRAFRRNNKLSKERIAMLDQLGFMWKLKRPDDFWVDKLDELKRYKAQFGNVNPPRDGEWKLLACWVDRYVFV